MTPPPVRPHPLPPARWPTREEASRARLFAPFFGGRLETCTRTWVPAMVPWRADPQGTVTRENLAWYARFAEGRPGVLVAEATGIRDVPSGPLLRIGHDRFVPGLRDLVETVRQASQGQTRFLVQILDFLAVKRRPSPETYFARFLEVGDRHRERLARRTGEMRWHEAPDADVRAWLTTAAAEDQAAILDPREHEALCYGYRERVTDVHLPHIRDLPRDLPPLFAAAAQRARAAGFDGVELHFAHAYTMASFLSRTNDRADGYGGTRAGRVRLAREVLLHVRRAVGHDYVVGARMLGDDVVRGGSRIADACAHAVHLANHGLDFVSVSKGGRFEDARPPRVGEAVYPYTGPSGHECMPTVRIDERGPFGRNVPLASAIRGALRAASLATPVVAAGGVCTFDQAEAVLRHGHADFVAAARQSLADPDWWEKMRTGRGAEIRRCQYTNYCEGLDQRHREVTCKLWDRDFPEGEGPVARALDGRRRLLPPRWHAQPGQSSGRT